jgi:hypothetical protein
VKQDIAVEAGTIAPWYGQPGGGIQYKLPNNKKISELGGYIEEIDKNKVRTRKARTFAEIMKRRQAMTVNDLQELLIKNGVSETAYVLPPYTFSRSDGVYYLQHKQDGRWRIFFLERGNISDESFHATEDEACRRFKEIFYPKLAE